MLVSTSLLPRLSIHPHRCGISRCWFDSMIMTAWLWQHDSMMTAVRRRNRLEWANAHIQWHLALWRGVLFMDESRFSLNRADDRQRVWRRVGERFSDVNVVDWVAHGGSGVMVSGGKSTEKTYSSKSIITFQKNVVWVRGVRYDDFWSWTIKMSCQTRVTCGCWGDSPLLCKALWVPRKALYKCNKLLLL